MPESGLRRWIRVVGGTLSASQGRNLSSREAEEVFAALLDGEGSDGQVGALFSLIRARGAAADELVGFARAARARLEFPSLPAHSVVVATTRLGKLQSPPIGLASAAAAAASGAKVLVQASGRVEGGGPTLGDLWQDLVGERCSSVGTAEAELRQRGLACWCPTRSDAGWERLLRVEEEVGLRSVPDQVSKLLAPSQAAVLVPSMAGPVLGLAGDALASLGHQRCIILQGVEGSIDPSVAERSRGMLLEDGMKLPLRLQPDDLALSWPHEPHQTHEDRLESARQATARALMGIAPEFHVAQLGAAILLRLSGLFPDFASASVAARDAIESGRASALLYDVPRA
ncbi:MAG: hypothetical protein CMJ94_02795 [Planctomycetes bacterium]|nr:hypothetical protein [Planctomycetota bacterium]